MKTLNINSYVRIKLTPFGIEKLKKNHEELRIIFPSIGKFTPPDVDENGFCKMQLWNVMKTFGQFVDVGRTKDLLPFDTDIQVDDEIFE